MIADRTSLAALSPDRLALAFNAAYAAYVVPVHFDAAAISRHLATNGVALERSPLWLDAKGEPLALAALALRDGRAWIGGFGIVAGARGRGLSHALLAETLDAATAAGAREIALEVLVNNPRAIGTYERGGFVVEGAVAGFERAPGIAPPPLERRAAASIGPADAYALLDRVAEAPGTTWQNSFATLRRLDAVEATVAGDPLRPDAFIVFRETPRAVSLLAADGDASALAVALSALLHDLPNDKAVAAVNVPDGLPFADVLAALGFAVRFRQHVMRRALT